MAARGPSGGERARRAGRAFVLGLDLRLLLLACTVGALAGMLATLYFLALGGCLALSERVGHHVPVWLLMPAAGVLIGLTWLLGEPGETDAVVDNIHLRQGRMDIRANLPLIPCSLLSIAAGGSAGPEAPTVYLTGSIATWLHRVFKLPERDIRTLTLTGMTVGFASLFGAPVGGAIFALEIPHKRGMEYYEAIIPAVIGSLVGYGVFAALTHQPVGSIWHFPAAAPGSWHDFPLAAAIGVLCGLASFLCIGLIRGFKRLFSAWHGPMPVKAALGGLLLGLIAWKLPATRFWGEGQLQSALLDAHPGVWLLLLFAVAKMATVGITLASGWRGGIIIPCFFIGACLGKALALICPWIDPTLGMLCGMAAVNVAVMKVPLASVLVVGAMSGISAAGPVATAAFAAFVVSGGIHFLQAQRERPPAPGPDDRDGLRALTPIEARPGA